MKTILADTQPDADDYSGHWFLLIMLVAALVFYVHQQGLDETAGLRAPPPVASGTADWYWVLRMPEVTGRTAHDDVAQKRLRQWLIALKEEGFYPITLSDVRARLRQNQGLPENAVVVVFDPGYRHTFQALAPVLNELRWPVVWMTPRAVLNDGNTHYISLHQARRLERLGWWDIQPYDAQDPPQGQNNGKIALNQGLPSTGGHRLNVNATWTKQELIDRLLAERPLREKSYLTLREIQTQRWGALTPVRSSTNDPSFRFQATSDRRGTWLSWAGTRGCNDIQVELRATRLTGELWTVLRSDDKAGQGVRVALANGRIVVEEERNHERLPVSSAEVPDLRQPSSFTATVTLTGERLQISVNGSTRLMIHSLARATSKEGVVRLMIYDKITGAAGVDQLTLLATPL